MLSADQKKNLKLEKETDWFQKTWPLELVEKVKEKTEAKNKKLNYNNLPKDFKTRWTGTFGEWTFRVFEVEAGLKRNDPAVNPPPPGTFNYFPKDSEPDKLDFEIEFRKIDVKNSAVKVPPGSHFFCPVNEDQYKRIMEGNDINTLVFTTFNLETNTVTLFGWLTKWEFKELAIKQEAGAVGEFGRSFSATDYIVKVPQLHKFDDPLWNDPKHFGSGGAEASAAAEPRPGSECRFCEKPIPEGEIFCNEDCKNKYWEREGGAPLDKAAKKGIRTNFQFTPQKSLVHSDTPEKPVSSALDYTRKIFQWVRPGKPTITIDLRGKTPADLVEIKNEILAREQVQDAEKIFGVKAQTMTLGERKAMEKAGKNALVYRVNGGDFDHPEVLLKSQN